MCVVCILLSDVCQYIHEFLGSPIKSTVVLVKKWSTIWRKSRRLITTVFPSDNEFNVFLLLMLISHHAATFKIEKLSFFQSTFATCVPLLWK